jgi:predicted GNAT family N-acyltransferase
VEVLEEKIPAGEVDDEDCLAHAREILTSHLVSSDPRSTLELPARASPLARARLGEVGTVPMRQGARGQEARASTLRGRSELGGKV